MKNLIIKTCLFTLGGVVLLLALLFGVFVIFFPSVLANTADKLGNYDVAIHYYEKQYDKTQSLDDLFVLCKKLDVEKSPEDSKSYLSVMINSDGFVDFCLAQDKGGEDMACGEYLTSKYVCAIYECGQKGLSIIVAKDMVEEYGYTSYNPFYTLTVRYGESMTDDELNELKTAINEVKVGLTGSQLETAENDLLYIEELLK